MNKETKLRIHNITAKAALKFGNETWVLKKREKQRLEAAQMKFLRHLLGITKLDKERINVLGKITKCNFYPNGKNLGSWICLMADIGMSYVYVSVPSIFFCQQIRKTFLCPP